MPKTNIPVGKVMSKPRSQWGTVIPRYDDSGSLSAWQVRYPNPVDHGKKVQKQFTSHIRSTRLMCGWRTSIIWSIYIPKASKRGFIPVTA